MDKYLERLMIHYDQVRKNLDHLIRNDLGDNGPAIAEVDREFVATFDAILSAEVKTQLQFHTRMHFITERIRELSEGSNIIDKLTDKILSDFSNLMEKENIAGIASTPNIYPIRDIGNEIARYNTIRNDLDAQKNDEKAVRFRANYLEQAINSISDAFILYDASGNLIFYNQIHLDFYPHLADLYRSGATRKEIWRHHAKKIREMDPEMDVEGYVAERQLHSSKLRPDFERKLIDGRWVATRERFLADGGLVSIRTDITWQKKLTVDQAKHGT